MEESHGSLGSNRPLPEAGPAEGTAGSFSLEDGARTVLRIRHEAAVIGLAVAALLLLVAVWIGVVTIEQGQISNAVLLIGSIVWFPPIIIYLAVGPRPAPADGVSLDAHGVTFHFAGRPDRSLSWRDPGFGILLRDDSWRPKSGPKPNAPIFVYLKPEKASALAGEATTALPRRLAEALTEEAKRQGIPTLTRPELVGHRWSNHPALVTRLGTTADWSSARPMAV